MIKYSSKVRERFIRWVPNKSVNTHQVAEYMEITSKSNHFTNGGPLTCELEKWVYRTLSLSKGKSVVCVNNGSVGIQVLCASIEYTIGRRLRWATQSFTFPQSAQGYLNDATIIDIDEGGGLDLSKVNVYEVDGIIVTNVFGNVVDINKYIDWAKIFNKYIVFDNAATPCTYYGGLNSCDWGHGSIISFHHTKPIGFGEGGAIIVDEKYETAVRRLINFGLDNKHHNVQWSPLGVNGKMSDISAIYILQYLTNYHKIVSHHRKLYFYFDGKLKGVKGVRLYPNHSDAIPFVSCFCLLFDEYDDNLRKTLLEKGVYCRKYYKPLKPTPIASKLYKNVLCIPCTTDMVFGDIDFVLKFILSA